MKIGTTAITLKATEELPLQLADGSVITLEVNGLPLNWDDLRDQMIPVPNLPKRFVQDAKGAVLRDPESNEVLFEADDSPGEVQTKIDLAVRNQRLLMVYIALRKTVTFESMEGFELTGPESGEDFLARADALAQELTKAGFGTGHILKIQRAALAASGVNDEVLDKARKSFS